MSLLDIYFLSLNYAKIFEVTWYYLEAVSSESIGVYLFWVQIVGGE